MSESEKLKRFVDQSVLRLHEYNKLLEAEKRAYRENVISLRSEAEFYKQQSEFWASECISEQRKTSVSIVLMFFGCAATFIAIAAAIFACQ